MLRCTDDVGAVALRALPRGGTRQAEGSDTPHVSRERLASRAAGRHAAASGAEWAVLCQSGREELASTVPQRSQDLRRTVCRRRSGIGLNCTAAASIRNFFADRTWLRLWYSVVSACRLSVVCNVCIVAKRYVLPENCLKKQTGFLNHYSAVPIRTFSN